MKTCPTCRGEGKLADSAEVPVPDHKHSFWDTPWMPLVIGALLFFFVEVVNTRTRLWELEKPRREAEALRIEEANRQWHASQARDVVMAPQRNLSVRCTNCTGNTLCTLEGVK